MPLLHGCFLSRQKHFDFLVYSLIQERGELNAAHIEARNLALGVKMVAIASRHSMFNAVTIHAARPLALPIP